MAWGDINTQVTSLNAVYGDHGSQHGPTGIDPLPGIAYCRAGGSTTLNPNAEFYGPPLTISASQGPTFTLSVGGAGGANGRLNIPAGYGGLWAISGLSAVGSGTSTFFESILNLSSGLDLFSYGPPINAGYGTDRCMSACEYLPEGSSIEWVGYHNNNVGFTWTYGIEIARIGP